MNIEHNEQECSMIPKISQLQTIHTLDHTAAEPASSGLTARMTRVNFQPKTNPIIKPATNLQKNCTNTQILSPRPSLIVFMSLSKREWSY